MKNGDQARREVMASKEAGNRGDISKIGQLIQNSKQKKLITQERNSNKKIIVKVKNNEDRDELEKFKEDLSQQVNKEMEVLRKELKIYKEYIRIKDRLWEERIKEMEERVEELEEKVGELEGWEERLESSEKSIDVSIMSEEEKDWSVNDENRSEYSESRSDYSRRVNDYERSISQYSEDRLSNWEVKESKKLFVNVEERETRKCNIVIKGMLFPKDIEKNIICRTQWVQEFIKEKLEVECKVISSRSSGPVIIARIGSVEQKDEIMQNKYKLKEHNIFIDHDLSWEEREIQRKILRWVIEQRNKGENAVVGMGKVKVGGVWKLWEKIEEEEDKKNNKEEEVETAKLVLDEHFLGDSENFTSGIEYFNYEDEPAFTVTTTPISNFSRTPLSPLDNVNAPVSLGRELSVESAATSSESEETYKPRPISEELGSTQQVPEARELTYEFLLLCAAGPYAKRPPADWARIQKECPNIVRKVPLCDRNANHIPCKTFRVTLPCNAAV